MIFQRGRRGRRPDLGNQFFDSSGEANFARILKLLQIKYERGHRIDIEKLARKYEFKHTESGHYLKEMRPDFHLPDSGIYIEVKPAGMTLNDRMRIASVLLKEEGVKLELIMPTTYKILERAFKGKIEQWET